MNESFLLKFTRGGAAFRLLAASNGGGLTFDEPDPFTRGFGFQFGTDNPVTDKKWQQVRQRLGLDDEAFTFTAVVDGGNLRLSGLDPNALPSGDYWIRVVGVEDETVDRRKRSFTIAPDSTTAAVTIPLPGAAHDVTLAFGNDAKIARLLDCLCPLDGGSLRAWLKNPNVEPRRKAAALNLVAKLRSFPTADDPFIDLVTAVFEGKPDRIYASVKPELHERLLDLTVGDGAIVQDEGTPVDSVHDELLADLPVALDAAVSDHYALDSFRADGRPSLQTVVAIPPTGDPHGYYADFDLDQADSLEDITGFVVHMGEIANGTLTDHFALRAKLVQDTDIKPFVYYSVANA
jgi:hypothetical protein